MSTQDLPHEACACDGGVTSLTPASLANLSGRSALAYRVGTHGSFTATMRAALARQAALAGLTTRKEDDPSIALLDAWAAVLDVLTFYQERIANEGYIRTATEQRSVLELARAIGYELNPGVAASAFLAFTVDETEGSPAAVTLEAGTKVQSVPGQDELPQIFETTETFDARRDWNTLTPQAAERLEPRIGTTTISLQGTADQPQGRRRAAHRRRRAGPRSDESPLGLPARENGHRRPAADADDGLEGRPDDRRARSQRRRRVSRRGHPQKRTRRSMRSASGRRSLDTTRQTGWSCPNRSRRSSAMTAS